MSDELAALVGDVEETPRRRRSPASSRVVAALEGLADELAHNPTLKHDIVLKLRALQRTKSGPMTDFLEQLVGE